MSQTQCQTSWIDVPGESVQVVAPPLKTSGNWPASCPATPSIRERIEFEQDLARYANLAKNQQSLNLHESNAELGRADRNCTLITVVNFFIKRLHGIATWITLECRSERLDDPIRMVHRHVKVLQKAVAKAVDPAVDCQLVTARPSILDHGAQRDVAHLLDHVHFTKNVFLLLRRKMIKPFSVTKTDILNMPQPVVRKADTSSVSCSAYAGTSVVTNHHDVFNFKVFHCKLDRRKCIQIRGHNQIRDVSVHKYFARVEAGYLVCGHAAIRASNPHVFRALLTCQSGKESRHPSLCSSGPVSIIGKQMVKFVTHSKAP